MHKNILFILGWLALAGSAGAQDSVDGIAAIVNREVITLSDVRKEVDPVEEELRAKYQGLELVEKVKAARLKALNDLIDRKLVIWDFKNGGFFLPDAVVDERVQSVIKMNDYQDTAGLVRVLKNNGMTLVEFREEIADQVIAQAMRFKMVLGPAGAKSSVPDEVEAERKRLEKEWIERLRSQAFIKIYF